MGSGMGVGLGWGWDRGWARGSRMKCAFSRLNMMSSSHCARRARAAMVRGERREARGER